MRVRGAAGDLPASCGIRLSWVVHVRLAVVVRGIGEGLSALPNVLVPYNGINDWVRVVVSLGAGLLLLGGGAHPLLRPPPRRRSMACRRRGAAARSGRPAQRPVPAPASIPARADPVRLLAMFMWGDRIRRYDTPLAIGVSILAGAVALIAAPRIDPHRPWLDFRPLAGIWRPLTSCALTFRSTTGRSTGPAPAARCSRSRLARPDYWKAEDLDMFDGRGWVARPPAPRRSRRPVRRPWSAGPRPSR